MIQESNNASKCEETAPAGPVGCQAQGTQSQEPTQGWSNTGTTCAVEKSDNDNVRPLGGGFPLYMTTKEDKNTEHSEAPCQTKN